MAKRNDDNAVETLGRDLLALAATLEQRIDAEPPAGAGAKRLRERLRRVTQQLSRSIEALDPVRQPAAFFDPTNPSVLGRMVGIALIAGPRNPLSRVSAFYGSGVYALYYTGPMVEYAPIAGTEHPIYVGKADPSNAQATSPREQGDRLFRRLKDHSRSIGKAQSTLSLDHFDYRALVVQSGWETAAEKYLIDLFRPIWNKEVQLVFGIGKHGDKTDTRANLRSPWDTLHPGRPWAHAGKAVADAKDLDEIRAELELHYRAVRPFNDVDGILRRFLDEMGVL